VISEAQIYLNTHVVHLVVIGPMEEENVKLELMAASRRDVVPDILRAGILPRKTLEWVATRTKVFVMVKETA